MPTITVPGHGEFEFPEGMSDEEMSGHLSKWLDDPEGGASTQSAAEAAADRTKKSVTHGAGLPLARDPNVPTLIEGSNRNEVHPYQAAALGSLAAVPMAGMGLFAGMAPEGVAAAGSSSPWAAAQGVSKGGLEAAPWVKEAGRMAKAVAGNKYVKAAGVGAAATAAAGVADSLGVPEWVKNLGTDAVHWWIGSKIWGH